MEKKSYPGYYCTYTQTLPLECACKINVKGEPVLDISWITIRKYKQNKIWGNYRYFVEWFSTVLANLCRKLKFTVNKNCQACLAFVVTQLKMCPDISSSSPHTHTFSLDTVHISHTVNVLPYICFTFTQGRIHEHATSVHAVAQSHIQGSEKKKKKTT